MVSMFQHYRYTAWSLSPAQSDCFPAWPHESFYPCLTLETCPLVLISFTQTGVWSKVTPCSRNLEHLSDSCWLFLLLVWLVMIGQCFHSSQRLPTPDCTRQLGAKTLLHYTAGCQYLVAQYSWVPTPGCTIQLGANTLLHNTAGCQHLAALYSWVPRPCCTIQLGVNTWLHHTPGCQHLVAQYSWVPTPECTVQLGANT